MQLRCKWCVAAALAGLFGVMPGALAAEGEAWDLVYIGDSWLPEASRIFGQHIEADLGVEVRMWQRNAARALFATSKMKNGEWELLRDAEVIVVHLDGPTSVEGGFCLNVDGERGYGIEPEAFRAEADAFLSELTRLADPETTIIRIGLIAILPGMVDLWAERDVVEECTAGWIALNQQWTDAAAAHGIATVDVLAAWNGPDGTRDAPVSYFRDEIGHMSDEGAAAAAALMRAMGYAPLAH